SGTEYAKNTSEEPRRKAVRRNDRVHVINADGSRGFSPQELGEQLLHDLGLVVQDHMVRIVDQLDPRLRQLLSEAGCRPWPVMDGLLPADDRQNRNPGR
ncbi:MAG TPA: hypothetical protein VK753_04040, partial [Xanthomonadaceae bacterium]|nr:hypothetical protein [Xanthomonadaceae bacterium]